MKIVQEEIFGPVGVLIKFEDEEDVIRQANDTLYGLAAAVFTRDINRALETAHSLKAGTAWINCCNTLNANVPFGGFKQSGSTHPPFSWRSPQRLDFNRSDLQLVANWESTPCTTTPTLRRSTLTSATRCKFTKGNGYMRVRKNGLPPWFLLYFNRHIPHRYYLVALARCSSRHRYLKTEGFGNRRATDLSTWGSAHIYFRISGIPWPEFETLFCAYVPLDTPAFSVR
jgi:hypothetical protein